MRRPARVEETPGPGTFNPEAAADAVRPKSPMTKMSKSRARPKSFAKSGDGPAPGQYDDGKRFNSNVKPMTIGRARPRKVTTDAPGAGTYQPERAEALTRPKSAALRFDKSPARARPQPGNSDTTGPGAYDCGKKFGKDIKPITFGKRRADPPRDTDKNPGAGSYNPDAADALTRAKTPGVNMGKSPSRPSTFAKPGYDTAPGPGCYDDGKRFNSNVKPMTIGRSRPRKVTTDVPGAGSYEPNDALTKPKAPATINMSRSPMRPSNFEKQTGDDVGPGAYDSPMKFGADVKPITIGRKRPERNPLMDNPGAGSYAPENADNLTRPKCPNVDMGRSPSRPSTFAKPGSDELGGPGQYDLPNARFGSDVKPMTIGARRPQKVGNDVPDAGCYDPSAAEGLTRPKAPATVDMSRAPAARPEPPVSQTADAADFYDHPGQTFGANMKPVTFGQRREPIVDRIEVGPGAYDAQPDVVKERLKGGKID